MAGTVYSGTITTGITLNNPATQRPVTVTGTVTDNNATGSAIYGNTDFAWTVDNQGTIENTSTTGGTAIQLGAGGTVNNQTQPSVSPSGSTGGSLIQGYSDGILIQGAAGVVTNLGNVKATGTSGIGVDMTAGGAVSNGSAGDTLASISGGSHGIAISGAAGAVTNFASITSSGAGSRAVALLAGGAVANGSGTDTTALISGQGAGVYIGYGSSTVTNFGTIEATVGGNGVALRDGGRVTNGQSGSTAGLIIGVNAPSVIVSVAAGTVSNFGTIRQNGTAAAVELVQGGTVTNGASGATSALITGLSTGAYADNLPATVTNFGGITATSATNGNGIALFSGGSVTNFGTVQNTDTSDAGVYLRGGGSVTNGKTGASVGLISGASNGVSFRGGAGTVTNAGSIVSPIGNGVYLNGGGNVTNQAGGVIAGHVDGVYNRGVAITVTNSGLIETTGTADGIYLRGGGSVANNAGGTITGSAAGIEIGQQGGVVTNHGVIKGVIGFYGGIFHSGSNTLINFGTVASTSTATGAVAVEMGSSVGNNKLLIVEPGAVFTGLVEGNGRGEIEFAATGTAALGGNISGFNRVALANGGPDSLTLANANFSGVDGRITVLAGNDGNTVNAAAVTAGQLTIDGGAGTDVLTGSANGSTIFVFTEAALTATDTITGSSYNNELEVTTPGSVAAAGVTGVQLYQLANGGANSLTLVNANFTNVLARPVNIYGGNDGNTIDGSALTGTTENLDIYGGAGADALKGGAGNDIFVFTAANLTKTDTVSGGGGGNELLMTTAGTVAAAGVTGVETYVLADGGPNTLTLTGANFTGVTGSTITVSDGNDGNTVNASGVAAPDRIIVYAGAGADVLTGGPGNDVFYAGGDTTMTGGAGTNEFVFTAPGNNTITDFAASTTNEILFSDAGFNLGLSGTGALPPALFVIGPFTAATQRFSYDSGQLFYSASGTTATEKLVATLSGAPALTATDLSHTATASTTYSGTYTTLVSLGNPATQRTATVTEKITNATGQGVFGNADFPWTVNNRGSIVSTSTTTGDFGVQLLAGGIVNNLVAAVGTTTPPSLISGYGSGVLIEFAPGAVSNLGEIEVTGVNGLGIDLNSGGKVTNGSLAVTTALITGPGNGVLIGGGAGTVTNFGTVEGTGSHTTIFLKSGGDVSNGSSTSTAALIANTGSAGGVYVGYGAGTVTNFGMIKGASTGVSFDDGGRVANGQSGSTAGLIVGTVDGAVSIAGTAGTVANFGTLQSLGTLAVVALNGGGTVTNGAVGATGALITGPGTGIYINNAPGAVTNFGHVTTSSTAVGTGIVFEDGGGLTNFGTVQNTFTTDSGVYFHGGGSVTNGRTGTSVGLISGAGNGVAVRGGLGTITNSATIEGGAKNGIYLTNGGSVTNQVGGVIAGKADGVYNRGVAITVTNSGLIETTGTADGIYLRGGGSVTNNAGGTIAGGAAGVYLHRTAGMVTNHGVIKGTIGFDAAGTGANTLINYGTVASTSTATGAVAVQMGNNTGRNLLVVEPGAVFTGLVEGGGRGEIEFAATGTAAMGGNISGFNTVALANGGADTLTLAQANFSGVAGEDRITVIGGNDGNTVTASAVTSPVTIDGGGGADTLTGGKDGNAIFVFTAAALTATDKITGTSYNNKLEITTAGTVAATAVTGVEIYQLANGGSNTLSLANSNFTGVPSGDHITVYGGTGGNTIDGSALTGAADNLDIYGGAGADALKGGAGNDIFSFAAANLTTADTISGGAGTNELLMTTAGTVAAANVTGVETYVLADGGANTLTLATANFTGVTGSTITVSDGNGGNTISAAGVAAADRTIVFAGTGADVLTGGPGTNVFYAGGDTRIDFAALQGGTTVNAFGSGTNEIAFSNAGFALGQSGASATPTALPAGLFTSNSTGAFTATAQRFAYDTTSGALFYSASGTTTTEHVVATLGSHPALTASHLFFIT